MAEKRSKLPAGAGSKDPRALSASSREAKRKTIEDKKLIKNLFDLEPLDWSRYPDGKLAFIAPNGSKAIYSKQQLDDLQAKKKPSAKISPAKSKTAAASPASQGEAGSPPASAADAAAAASKPSA